MNFHSKCHELKKIIYDTLPLLIGHECVYLDLPYYENIGDVLIWEGTETFLRENHIKCIYRASKDTFAHRLIPKEVPIILQGGGNFGDIWQSHQDFRLHIIEFYPENPIFILPQTVYYTSEENLKRDSRIMSNHENLTIFARDKESETLLERHFKNKIGCLPDMAFCIDIQYLKRFAVECNPFRNLFLRRCDQELASYDYARYISEEVEQHDWPTCERPLDIIILYRSLLAKKDRFNKIRSGWIIDFYARKIMKKAILKNGVSFLSQYNYIYTTRLHVAILSMLLEKPFTFFDNTYGKNKHFFNSWIKDCQDVKFILKDNE